MKILLAIDGSPCSEEAVKTLIHQYKPSDTEVCVLHAVESVKLTPIPPILAKDSAAIAERWRQEGEKLVAEVAKRLEVAGFKHSTKIEDGDPRDLIVEYAMNWQPDLILLGSHGKRGLDRFLLGSVSEVVARRAPCSVEIVRAKASAA